MKGIESLESRRLLSAGDLDASFGDGGKTRVGLASDADDIAQAVVLPDDKILLVGEASGQYLLRRLNADGSVDTTFGKGGVASGAFPDDGVSIQSIAVQSDGKIVAEMETGYAGGTIDFIRFNADGTLDMTYGRSGHVNTIDTVGKEAGRHEAGTVAIAVQPDNKLLFADDFDEVIRYNTDGSLDSTFGTDGTANAGLPSDPGASSNDAGTRSILVQPDGKIILAGSAWHGPLSFALGRFNSDGSPDTTFGNQGQVRTSMSDFDDLDAALLLPDGKILAAGSGIFVGDVGTDEIIRYNADGSIDSGFSAKGLAISFANDIRNPYPVNLALDKQGNAILIGTSEIGPHGVNITRITADGQVDGSFGRVVGENDDKEQMVVDGGGVQSDGNIVVAGEEYALHTGSKATAFTTALRFLSSDSAASPVELDSSKKRLVITGTAGDDRIEAQDTMGEDSAGEVQAELNGIGRVFDSADVSLISVTGGAGNDIITMSLKKIRASVSGGDGSDKITGGEKNDILMGNGGRDFIDGGNGPDHISGGGGNDQLNGQGGNDLITGGAGKDFIEGGGGNDRLDGGAGSDTLHGNAGNDTLFAEDGEVDSLFGDGGKDSGQRDSGDVLQSIEANLS